MHDIGGTIMTTIIILIAGILVIDIIRLCLAIKTQKKIDKLNASSAAQQKRWNQMCEETTAWFREAVDAAKGPAFSTSDTIEERKEKL